MTNHDVWNADNYNTWNGSTWGNYRQFIDNRVRVYSNPSTDDQYGIGLLSAYSSIKAMIGDIEKLPFSISAYDAFALLASWAYVQYAELAEEKDDCSRARRDIFEDCYTCVINPYQEEPDVYDVYSYVKRLAEIALPFADYTSSDRQIVNVYYGLSVKKPHGTKLYLNADVSLSDIRCLLGIWVVEAINSPLSDSDRQARLHVLCKVLHKVF